MVWRSGLSCLSLAISQVAFGRSLAEIKKTKELRGCVADIVSVAKVTPDGCTDSCTGANGANFEILEVFAKELGVNLKVIGVAWDQQFWNAKKKTERGATYSPELMQSGKCDVYTSDVTKVEWRTKLLDFAILFPNRLMIVIHKDDKEKYKKPEDLAGHSVAVEKDTSFHTWADDQNKSTYQSKPLKVMLVGPNENFKSVEDKKADFTPSNIDMALYSVSRTYKNTMVAFPVGPITEIGWAVKKGEKELQDEITKFFEKNRKNVSSEVNHIWKKYYNMNLLEFSKVVSDVKK